MPLRAVVVDVGNVLEVVEPVTSWLATWQQRLGLEEPDFERRLGEVDPQGFMGTGDMSEAEYRRRVQAALHLDDEETANFMTEMWNWYCGRLDTELVEFVRSLRPTYRTAILSNSADGARREEQSRYNFEQLVDVIVYSHEVGLEKPDPRIFKLTCERLRVEPSEALFVDDVEDNIAAAEQLGMQAIHHRRTPDTIRAVRRLLSGA